MNTPHRYSLEKGSKKHICPRCQEKRFVRYVNNLTNEYNEYLADDVGKCDRADDCNYHKTPSEYFKEKNIKIEIEKTITETQHGFIFRFPFDTVLKNAIKQQPNVKFDATEKRWVYHGHELSETIKTFATENQFRIIKKPKEKPASFISPEVYGKKLNRYTQNNFVSHLRKLFATETVHRLIERFFIGTSGKYPNATLFPQIDNEQNIRTAKIMLYYSDRFNRAKINGKAKIAWLHTEIKEFNLKQCFFGLHQIQLSPVFRNPDSFTIGIVESEKTAVVLTGLQFEHNRLPNMILLAAGQLNGLNIEKMKPLKTFKIILFPDLSKKGTAFELWKEKAAEFKEQGYNISVSDLLEKQATPEQRADGFDLADYIIEQINPNGSNAIKTQPQQQKKIKSNTIDALNYLIAKNPNVGHLQTTFDTILLN